MNLTRRLTLLAPILLGVILLTQVLGVQEVWAAWNPAGETTVATYEVIPAEKRVHVALSYRLKNLDEETRSGDAYYYSWTVVIPLETTNIKAYDANTPLSFTISTDASWTYLKLQLNKKLYYGQAYDFTIDYDLATTRNVSVFSASGKGNGASTIRVVLPRGYYDEVSLTPIGYTKSETDTQTIYTYAVAQEGWRLYTFIEAAKKSDYQSLSGAVKLQEREVRVTVRFWEGEEAKARNILSLSLVALPALEDVIGVAFPPAYQVVIEEVTEGDIGGYGGENAGKNGIHISYTSMDSDDLLVHELAHYWANQPPWKENWMIGGYAELYAYLTLVKLGKESTAEKEIMESRISSYEKNKDRFELSLSLWSRADVLTEENTALISFGYSKSFVFVFNLYSKYVAGVLQKANQMVYRVTQSVDWFDYLHILETSTGQELGLTFVGWVVPQSFGTTFDRWQSGERAYWETNQTVAERKGALGISIVEAELEQGKRLIMNGDFAQALSQIESTTLLFREWETTEKAFRAAEATVVERKGALGISIVEVELEQGKKLIVNGDFAQALSQIESTTLLFREWETTEKAFRAAEGAIAQAKSEGRTWRLGNTEQIMVQATTLMRGGKLKESLSQSQLAREIADNTTTPLFGIIALLAPYFAGLVGLFAVFIVVRRLRAKARQG